MSALALLIALLPACTPWLERGRFALVTTDPAVIEHYERLTDKPARGEGCFTGRQADDRVFSWAVEDALAGVPGATTLLDPVYTNHIEDKRSCLQVTGWPARLRDDNANL
jgi:hypothetical protein